MFQHENDQLLQQVDDECKEVDETSSKPKRNTKKALIERIKELCEGNQIELHESETTLQRSSKAELQKLLAQKVEETITKKLKLSHHEQNLQETVAAREAMCVNTLTYGLFTLNKLIDRGANLVLPKMGYKLENFLESFEHPRTRGEINEIMLLICRENPNIIEHFASPYLRLMFVLQCA